MTGQSPKRSFQGLDLLARTFLFMETIVPDPADVYIGAFLRLEGPSPAIDEFRSAVASNLDLVPSLTLHPRGGEVSAWGVDEDFALERHVVHLSGAPTQPAPARAWLTSTPEHDHPLWRLFLVTADATDEWAVVYLVHHAMQDGTAMLRTLETLFGTDQNGGGRQRHDRRHHRPAARHAIAALPDLAACTRSAPRLSVMTAPPAGGLVLSHRSVPTEELRAAGHSSRATIGQTNLAAVAGAVRRWSPTDYSDRPSASGLPVCVPLDTRVDGEVDVVGSRIGLMRVVLPANRSEPAERIRAMTRRLSRRRVTARRRGMRALTERVRTPWAAKALQRLGDRRAIAMTVSTYRPLGPLEVCGAAVRQFVALPWMPPGHSCFCILSTYDGQSTLSVLTDTAIDPRDDLARCWADEVTSLRHPR